jgi:hypothetical protein
MDDHPDDLDDLLSRRHDAVVDLIEKIIREYHRDLPPPLPRSTG